MFNLFDFTPLTNYSENLIDCMHNNTLSCIVVHVSCMPCLVLDTGLQDMIPLPTDDTYEGFEDLMERTNSWLKDKRDLYVTNLQSVMVQKTDG